MPKPANISARNQADSIISQSASAQHFWKSFIAWTEPLSRKNPHIRTLAIAKLTKALNLGVNSNLHVLSESQRYDAIKFMRNNPLSFPHNPRSFL